MKYISSMADCKDLALTIYNNHFGLVKETRNVNTKEPFQELQYLDVAEKIEIDSILVDGLNLRELNFDYDLVSKEKMLEKYLDEIVTIHDEQKGTKNEYRLLSVHDGIVVEDYHTKEILINPRGEMILPKLPDGLIVRPSLSLKVHPTHVEKIRVSYLTKGIDWSANYVINLKTGSFDISGWVNIVNNTGTTFDAAQIKLIAGDVQRINDYGRVSNFDNDVSIVYSSVPSFEEESFSDYHLYTLKDKTQLKNKQSKQINFLQYERINYLKYYQVAPREEQLQIIVEFKNSKENGLGIPLPKGKIKVYSEENKDGSLEFIGEDSIDHTPKNEKLRLHIGNAFDLKAESNLIDSSKDQDGIETETYEYKIRNHKEEEALVKINHYIRRKYWEIDSCSHEYSKENSNEIVFWTKVPPNHEEVITFKVRMDDRITLNIRKRK